MVLWFPFPPYFHIKEDGFYGISGFIAVFLKNGKQLLPRKSVTGKHQKRSKYSEPECWWLNWNKNKPPNLPVATISFLLLLEHCLNSEVTVSSVKQMMAKVK